MAAERIRIQKTVMDEMQEENEPVPIVYRNPVGEIIDIEYVYYSNSELLRLLSYYPIIQLTTILFFAILAYLAFSYSLMACCALIALQVLQPCHKRGKWGAQLVSGFLG